MTRSGAPVTPPRPSDPRPETSGGPIPAEARVFAQMALFGVVIGAIYWFLTYESAGSVMLVAFGVAAAIATIAITLGDRARRTRGAGRTHDPADSTAAPLPRPGWAPLLIGIGLGGVAIGAAFGPWLAIAGLLVVLVAARGWLRAAMDEVDAARGTVDRFD